MPIPRSTTEPLIPVDANTYSQLTSEHRKRVWSWLPLLAYALLAVAGLASGQIVASASYLILATGRLRTILRER